MRRTIRWVAVVLVAATALAACGGGDDGSAGGGNGDGGAASGDGGAAEGPGEAGLGDGCELVTEADAESLLGEAVEVQPEDGLGEQVLLASCTWGVDTETSFKMVQLHVFNGAQFFDPEIYREEDGFEEITGLGDGAFIVKLLGLEVQVLDGDRTVSLLVSGFNVDDPDFTEEHLRPALLELTEKVLDRM